MQTVTSGPYFVRLSPNYSFKATVMGHGENPAPDGAR
jgi:hypothetical protein